AICPFTAKKFSAPCCACSPRIPSTKLSPLLTTTPTVTARLSSLNLALRHAVSKKISMWAKWVLTFPSLCLCPSSPSPVHVPLIRRPWPLRQTSDPVLHANQNHYRSLV